MTVYRIINWDTIYENNRSRRIQETNWVPLPNDLSSYGYRLMLAEEKGQGPAIFGCFVAIVELASKCDPRGTLLRGKAEPHTPESIAIKSGMPEGLIQETLDFCVNRCKWIEIVELNPEVTPASPKSQVESPEWKGMEGNGNRYNRDDWVKSGVIPESLNTREFLDAWEEWCTEKFAEGNNLTDKKMVEQIAYLSTMGPVRAVACIKYSIRQGFKGLYEKKSQNGGTHGKKQGKSYRQQRAEREFPEPEIQL